MNHIIAPWGIPKKESISMTAGISRCPSGIAATKNCTVAQLTLAWVMAQGNDIVPIVGTRAISRVDESVGVVDVHLSDEDITLIEQACPPNAVAGPRVPGASRISK